MTEGTKSGNSRRPSETPDLSPPSADQLEGTGVLLYPLLTAPKFGGLFHEALAFRRHTGLFQLPLGATWLLFAELQHRVR